jgi:hypothetical protein
MRALVTLIIAGATAALFSAPALAAERVAKLDVTTAVTELAAQESCVGWGVRCELDVTPEFCIAADKCATALPGSAMLRYAERMAAIAGR